ncbi:MAG: ECF-type sigma factor [Planctomycetota bacterium]
MQSKKQRTTELLTECRNGHIPAFDQLFESVYSELKVVAALKCANESKKNTLEPTALVHEAYLRLVNAGSVDWEGRTHFKAIAAKVMRQLLIDQHRAREAVKRGGGWRQTTLSGLHDGGTTDVDSDAVRQALEQLEALDARQAQIVELRFFGGMTEVEIAHYLQVSRSTVQSEWRFARAWLSLELGR